MSELRSVEPLDPKRHQVKEFRCGQPSLDRWLQAHAGQIPAPGRCPHVRAGVSAHFPIPMCLIARLALDMSWQSRGLGSDLLRDALRRTLAASEQIGIRAVLVDAIDDHAAAFYRRYGFEPATTDGLALMVPLAAVRAQFRP